MKLDDMVGAYIKARDRKDAIKAEYAAKTADLDKLMAKIEGHLLKTFQETGVESCRLPRYGCRRLRRHQRGGDGRARRPRAAQTGRAHDRGYGKGALHCASPR